MSKEEVRKMMEDAINDANALVRSGDMLTAEWRFGFADACLAILLRMNEEGSR